MAMVNCPECGKEISDKASTCPNCGCPIRQNNTPPKTVVQTPPMPKKKSHGCLTTIIIIIGIFVFFAIVISVFANIGKSNNESDNDTTTQAENSGNKKTEKNSETLYEIGSDATLKDWTITVTDVKVVDTIAVDYGAFSPNEEGNKYIQVFVTVNNNGKQADNFLPTINVSNDVSAKVLYSDGYEFTSTNLLGYQNDLHDSVVNPLSSQTGEIVFEIPNAIADSEDELLIQFSSGNDSLKFKIR